MAQIGNVPEILAVKDCLSRLQQEGIIKCWELPYENLLTRLSAAIFFFTPAENNEVSKIAERLKPYGNFIFKDNDVKKLSELNIRMEWNKDS